MNKRICILNETFLKAIDSINELSFVHTVDNIILSTTRVMLFHIRKAS